MAMFTPSKSVTDTYYTDNDYVPFPIPSSPNITRQGIKKATIYSNESGFIGTIEVINYPFELTNNNTFSLRDNNGGTYNKMYFDIVGGHKINNGDVWNTTTKYTLNMSK